MKPYSDKLYNFFMQLLIDENKNFDHQYGKLTMNEVHIISRIAPAEEVTISELALRLNLSLSSTSIAVDHLIKKEFLTRNRCESDRRKVLISLGDLGREIYNSHSEFHMQRLNGISSGICEKDLNIFFDVIRKMGENLNAEENSVSGAPLSSYKEGDIIQIEKVMGGAKKASNLAELGIFEKMKIRVVRKQKYGPLILDVKGSRLSVGRKIADSIFGNKVEEK